MESAKIRVLSNELECMYSNIIFKDFHYLLGKWIQAVNHFHYVSQAALQ